MQVIFSITAALKQEAMGFGDVKLMGAIGALFGWEAVIYIVFFSALIGSVAGISLIALHRKGIQSQIPYGPYISLAAFSWLLGGARLWDAYLAIMGFYSLVHCTPLTFGILTAKRQRSKGLM